MFKSSFAGKCALLALAAALTVPTIVPASAQPYDRRREDARRFEHERHDEHRDWGHRDDHGDWGHRGGGGGAVIGGALLGLGLGAVVGSAIAAPPPVYYAPQPRPYAPPPPVYYGY